MGMPASPSDVPNSSARRILYVVSEDWYFVSHWLGMARSARAVGYEVHVATRIRDMGDAIAQEGFCVHPIPFARGSVGPMKNFRTILSLRRLVGEIQPDLVHLMSLQTIVLGTLATVGRHIRLVNALTGLGYAFIAKTMKARILKTLIQIVLCKLTDREGSAFTVENPDDRSMLVDLGISPKRIVLVPGAGIDLSVLHALPEPSGPMTMAFVGRLLKDKGVETLLAAHRLLRARGVPVELLIAGEPDPDNPVSLNRSETEALRHEPGVDWPGYVKEISLIWRRASIAVLPSRREGLPKSLLEAAAYGRALVATDVPGCREIVIAGKTGLLVSPDEPEALAGAIEQLIQDPVLRNRLAAQARCLVEDRFSSTAVGTIIVELYARLLGLDDKALEAIAPHGQS
jgi:glycosyltransferase involved in cell wall biosynthesis